MASFYTPTVDGIVRKRSRHDDDDDDNSENSENSDNHNSRRRRGNDGNYVDRNRIGRYRDDRQRYRDDRQRYRDDRSRYGDNRPRYRDDRSRYGDNRSRYGDDRQRYGDDRGNRQRSAPVQFDRSSARRILRARRSTKLFDEISTENSSAISRIVYLHESATYRNESCLYVTYRSSDRIIYRYKGVTLDMWNRIKSASSIGSILLEVRRTCRFTIVNHIPTIKDLELLLKDPENKSSLFYKYIEQNRNRYTAPITESNLRDIFLKWKRDSNIEGCYFSDMVHRLEFEGILVNQGNNYTFDFMKQRNPNLGKEVLKEEAERDKGGLVVSLVEGLPLFVSQYTDVNGCIRITNRGSTIRRLTEIKNSNEKFNINFNGPVQIDCDDTISITLAFRSNDIGFNKDVICLKFGSFSISRTISINVGNEEIRELLQPSSKYRRAAKSRSGRRLPLEYQQGEKKTGGGRPFINDIADVVSRFRDENIGDLATIERLLETLPRNVTFRWAQLMHLCLYAEEIQCIRDLDQFRMEDVNIRKVGNTMILFSVPGLAENRPSLLVGDKISIEHDHRRNYGYIWEIHEIEIVVSISNKLFNSLNSNSLVNVCFELNSLPFKLMHQGINKIQDNKWIGLVNPLYGIRVEDNGVRVTTQFNTNLNAEQMIAVKNIVEKRSTACYILFGPPGTGKSISLVEAIKQICHKRPNEKILVTASSNTAADLLCQKLSTGPGMLSTEQMLRFMAERRSVMDVSEECLGYSKIEGGSFATPDLNVLEGYKVVVATMATAAKLFNLDIKPGHFSVFIFDEAGYTSEPELISTFSSLLGEHQPQIVIAGDPKQLGPRCRSPLASAYGFSQSILERFITSVDCYKRDISTFPQSNGYNTNFITKLIKCYRCHDDILMLPNKFFYDNDLLAAGNRAVLDSFLNISSDPLLPNKKFPLIFHGCEGENTREASSPSWFNISECEVVLDYVLKLKENLRVYGIRLHDIGVISPYARQVQKIKTLLNLKGCEDVEVGSCEQFQGKEKRVIIISTVRTSTEYFGFDQKYGLGIISNEKRFNVACTRAQSLLIIVGDPKALATNYYWNALLKYSIDNNAYKGCRLPSTLPEPLPLSLPYINNDDDNNDAEIQLIIDPRPNNLSL